MRTATKHVVVIIAMWLVLVGCDSEGGVESRCAPGASIVCECAGGGSGRQVCGDFGIGVGECSGCPDDADAGGDEDLIEPPAGSEPLGPGLVLDGLYPDCCNVQVGEVALTADGETLLVPVTNGGGRGGLAVADLGQRSARLIAGPDSLTSVVVAPDGRVFASGSVPGLGRRLLLEVDLAGGVAEELLVASEDPLLRVRGISAAEISSAPTLDREGRLVVGLVSTVANGFNRDLGAFDPTTRGLAWITTPQRLSYPPSVATAEGGDVFFVTGDHDESIGMVRAAFPDTPVAWEYSLDADTNAVGGGLTAASGDRVLVATWSGLFILTPEGELRAQVCAAKNVPLPAVITTDGTGYAVCSDRIVAFHANGEVQWELTSPEPFIQFLLVGVDRTVFWGNAVAAFAASRDGRLVASWEYPAQAGEELALRHSSSAVLADDGTLYVATANGLDARVVGLATDCHGLAPGWPRARGNAGNGGFFDPRP